MASLIPPELMAQLMMRRNMPNIIGNPNPGMPAPGADQQGELMRAQNMARGRPQAGSMTPAGGPGGTSPMNEAVSKARLLDAFGVPGEDREKWKDVPLAQAHMILSAQSQQKHQAAMLEHQKQLAVAGAQREQQNQEYRQQRDVKSDRLEGEKLRHQEIGETNTALHDESSQEKELQGRLDKGETDPGINKDLTAVRQQLMGTRGHLNQLTAQQPTQGKPPLDPATAMKLYQQAGGNVAKARQLAQAAGF